MKQPAMRVRSHPHPTAKFTRPGDDFPAAARHGAHHGRSAMSGGESRAVFMGGLRLRRFAAVTVAALALAGCGADAPSAASDGRPVAEVATTEQPADTARTQIAGAGDHDGAAGQPALKQRGAGAQSSANRRAAASRPQVAVDAGGTADAADAADAAAKPAQPADYAPPEQDAFRVVASVAPACVRPGETIALDVTAPAQASVVYNAFYADGQAGGPAPYGAGYGGNDGGLADAHGHYSDTWVVAANSPSGPGHVEVIAGSDGTFGRTTVPFAVADAVSGECGE